jgi:hypothetical protein
MRALACFFSDVLSRIANFPLMLEKIRLLGMMSLRPPSELSTYNQCCIDGFNYTWWMGTTTPALNKKMTMTTNSVASTAGKAAVSILLVATFVVATRLSFTRMSIHRCSFSMRRSSYRLALTLLVPLEHCDPVLEYEWCGVAWLC